MTTTNTTTSSITSTPNGTTGNQTTTTTSRLPLILIPNHYDLLYKRIDFVHFTFEGNVTITCTTPPHPEGNNNNYNNKSQFINSIMIHALEIQIMNAQLKYNKKKEQQEAQEKEDDDDTAASTTIIDAIEYRYHRKNQTCEIVFNNNTDNNNTDDTDNFIQLIPNHEYILSINFMGILNNQMHGLYRSTYIDIKDNKTTKIMATTQFEATDARRAFPCFDEPNIKATFQLTISNIPNHLQCISNTPILSTHSTVLLLSSSSSSSSMSTSNYNKLVKTVTFQKTPKMSTYLLALIIGEFDSISKTMTSSSSNTNTNAESINNTIITTVYTVPGKAKQGSFCLDVASKCLDLYQTLFNIPYPLTKSDLIAIPDFAAGAMENWGCITYREAKVLVKPGLTSESTRRGIARTVCHELAHQWFGNLVTMDWWTQLYLNEGMARFMEFVAIDLLYPEWYAWTEFVQSVYGVAMSLDAMKSSHPVEVEVHHPDDIHHIFDSISYAKGASIIRMIASYIGMDNFFNGMRTYLTRHSYGNTVTNDLWIALEEASGKPVVAMMKSWTLEMGYPILQLSDNGTINCDRFLANGPENNNEPCTVWSIPVTAKLQGSDELHGPWVINGPNGDEKSSLEGKIQEWSSSSKWFKLNIDQTAFFRVNYSKEQWSRFKSVMNPDTSPLSTTDRLGLVSDCFAAGKAGYSSIVDAFMLVEGFGEHETADYAVWEELSDNLSALTSLYRSESFYGEFQSFLRRLYSRQMKILGWEPKPNESGRTGTLRATVISMMGRAADKSVIQTAFDLFIRHAADPVGTPISGDLRLSIYRCALRHDEATVYKSLKEMYENTTFPEEQRDCLTTMGCVSDPKLHSDMLDYTFNSGKVRSQDFTISLSTLATATDEGGRLTWEYFKANFMSLKSRFTGNIWPSCLGLCCSGMTTPSGADEVESFFRSPQYFPGSGVKRLAQVLEVIRTKVNRRERDRDSVEAYLRSSQSG